MTKRSSSSRAIDMTEGPILGRLVTFSLPIFLGQIFQQFYNMVDSIVVGRYVSSNALAAIGATSTLTMLLVCIMMGFNTGASIVASQLIGAGRKEDVKPTISTTLFFLVMLTACVSIPALIFSRKLLVLINVPENIMEQSLTYLRIYCLGLIFTALYNFFSAFLRAMGDSTTPLLFLIFSSLLNVAGDLVFVLVFHMGVAGVAWATLISQAISALLSVIYVRRTNEYFRFNKGEFRFDKRLFRGILRLGVPSCMQMGISCLGMVVVQGLINSFGSVDIAAYTAANKMENLCGLPCMSLAQALSLFVGQNVGAKNTDRARKGLRLIFTFSVLISIIMSAAVYFGGRVLINLFVSGEDFEVLETGTAFMKYWAPLLLIHAAAESLIAFLRGAGDSVQALISMLFDLGMRTLMAYLFVLLFHTGFYGIAWSIPCGWIAASVYSAACYILGTWKKKAVV